jgi:hypothetical protein
MEIGEIISDALVYPFSNIKALIIYLILGIIFGIVFVSTLVAIAAGIEANNVFAVFGIGIIGGVVSIFLGFMINGYQLDVIKYGIDRNPNGPEVDFIRQFFNGIKLFVTQIVYMIIPVIIGAILAVIFQHWLSGLITFIISLVFTFALMMAQCRLAKTEQLGDSLALGEAIGDISRVGIVKLLLLIIIVAVIMVILYFIVGLIAGWNGTVGGILFGIVGTYLVFFSGRAVGLLYSEV